MKGTTKISAVVLSIMPGLGQILTGRYFRGTVFFFAFLIALDLAVIIVPCVWEGTAARETSRALVIVAIIIWGDNMLDIGRIVWWRERESLQQKKMPFFRQGITRYLKDNFSEGTGDFRRILKLDRDDVDALFYLGVIARREGNPARAGRYFRRCLQLDETGKWRWEIDRISALE